MKKLEYISFPKNEYESLQARFDRKQIIYTTRVSSEANKYVIDCIYDSPFGKCKVVYLKHFTKLIYHPFLDELTEQQISEISRYINENGYDLIGLIKVS